jgi:hypothetical protein
MTWMMPPLCLCCLRFTVVVSLLSAMVTARGLGVGRGLYLLLHVAGAQLFSLGMPAAVVLVWHHSSITRPFSSRVATSLGGTGAYRSTGSVVQIAPLLGYRVQASWRTYRCEFSVVFVADQSLSAVDASRPSARLRVFRVLGMDSAVAGPATGFLAGLLVIGALLCRALALLCPEDIPHALEHGLAEWRSSLKRTLLC